MFILKDPTRVVQLLRLLRIRQARRDHSNCLYRYEFKGGMVNYRRALGPTSGLTRDEALRVSHSGQCGQPGRYCHKAVRDDIAHEHAFA